MQKTSKKQREGNRFRLYLGISGILLIVFAFIFNPLFIERFFSSDNHIDINVQNEVIFFEMVLSLIGCCFLVAAFYLDKISVKITHLFINIIIFFVSLLFIIAILELTIRIFDSQITYEKAKDINPKIFRDSSYLPFQLLPNSSDNLSDTIGEFNNTHIVINSYGLRSDEIHLNSKEDRNNEEVILMIGDSFVFGYGVNNNETFSQVLEALLNNDKGKKQGKEYEVINAGVPAYAPDSYYLYLKNEGISFSPDKIIIGFYVGNDIRDISANKWIPENAILPEKIIWPGCNISNEHQFICSLNQNIKKNSAFLSYLEVHVLENSHLYIFIKKRIKNMIMKEDTLHIPEWSGDLEKNWVKVKRLMLEIQKITKNNDIDLIVIIIPREGQISDESWSHYAKGMVRTKPQQEITAFLAENHISYIDLYPVFYAKQKQIPLYFKIDGHWNKEGHEIAAEEIFKYLKDNENKK